MTTIHQGAFKSAAQQFVSAQQLASANAGVDIGIAGPAPIHPPVNLPPVPQVATRVATRKEAQQYRQPFDKNRDGVLTRGEAPPVLLANFNKADSNHNGRITPIELQGFLTYLNSLG